MKEIYRQEGYVVNYYIDGDLFGKREITHDERKNFTLETKSSYVLDRDIELKSKTIPSGSTVNLVIAPNIKIKIK